MTPTSPPSQPTLEMASVLFTDIVGFSRNPLEQQGELLERLQRIVRETKEYQRAEQAGHLVKLPTGDGMALVFFQDPVAPVRCAIEIQKALRAHPELPLRTGVNTGPIFRHSDIQDNINVVGGGINLAQRVMDCGDAGHILVSRSIAEVLEQLNEWPQFVKPLGTFEVKHGLQIEVYNIVRDGAGNEALPSKLKTMPKNAPSPAPGPSRRLLPVWIGAGVAVLAGVGWFATRPAPAPPKPEPKIADAPGRTLQYHIILQRYRDEKPYKEPLRIAKEMAFEPDYRIRIVVSAAESGYLYIVNEGPRSTPDKPDINGFFPDPRVRDGSARLEAGQDVSIPSAAGYLKLDAQTGKEKLWLVWSVDPLPELEVIPRYVNAKDMGAVRDPQQARAIALLLKKYAGGNAAAESNDQGAFTTLRGPGKVLVRLIELEHV